MITIIGVHGVGMQQKGRLFAALTQAVAHGGYQSVPEEAFWSDEVEIDSDEDAFLFGSSKRLFYSISSVASEGFRLDLDHTHLRSSAQVGAQTLDIVAFGLFVVFALLFPITLGLEIFNNWFAARAAGSAAFLYPSRALVALLLDATLITSCATLVSGVAVQYLSNVHSMMPMWTKIGVAVKLASRRLIFFVAHAAISPPIWILSHLWPRALLMLLIGSSILASIVLYPIHWYVTPLFFPQEILARDPLTASPLVFLIVAGLGSLGILLLFLAFHVFKPAVKVLSDLTFYVGDASHRSSLLRHLGKKLPPDRPFAGHLVLVGHSLGSVIAVDYLRSNIEAFGHAKSVTLITMGSPLRRLMHWLFPASYPHPGELLSAFSNSLPNFVWLNIYRPFDPIGGKLFSRSQAAGVDCCTHQFFRDKLLRGNIFAQHEQYFEDWLVQDLCFAELKKQREFVERTPLPEFENRSPAAQVYVPRARRFRRRTATVAAAAGVSILGWLVFNEWPRAVVGLAHERIAAFEESSEMIAGTLEVGQAANLWISGHPVWPNYTAKGVFVPKGSAEALRVSLIDIDARTAFNWAARGQLTGYPLLNLAVRPGVIIRYNKNNPKEAVAEQFRAGRWLDRNGNWFNRAFVFFVLSATFLSLLHAQSGMAYRPARKVQTLMARELNRFRHDAKTSWD
ncbi:MULTISPECIES: hypothetical protein [Rhizobium]|uniref:hypothetical protein n=1 Tax=Rhizobium TaxID=379 RepID=UPI001C929E0A|nr:MULTISPECIES: hypothetical protein [Rhizobium]MBY3316601.1 hypothetical protein [Rhizobium laguerreae]MBY5369564.1 hypothetical protein [Rhizobium leguminosarum]MBY5452232.1 hypothetical protein [Rhizobium leguminosarum]